MMVDQELKEWFEAVVGTQLRHLTALVESQGMALRSIEMNTTTQITKINAQVEAIWKKVDDLQQQHKDRVFTIEKEEAARQSSDMSILAQVRSMDESQKIHLETQRREHEAEEKERSRRDEEQAVINSMVRNLDTKIDRLVWLLASTIILIVVYGVFELLRLRVVSPSP
jgi:hypothetical protein